MTLSANAEMNHYPDQELREFPVGAARRIYKSAYVGMDPAGYIKPFEPCDDFAGVAYEGADNSSGSAGDKDCKLYVMGDFEMTLAGAALTDAGKAVYATADDTLSLKGHPDAFVGRIVQYVSTNKVCVRLKGATGGLAEADTGSMEIVTDFVDELAPTGAAGGSTLKYAAEGFMYSSALGLGVKNVAGANGGVDLEFDNVSEIAHANLEVPPVFPVSGGVTYELRTHASDKGDHADVEFDFGLGNAFTANSLADINHADMAQIAAFKLIGASNNILAQSDDATTDVAPVDTLVDNVEAAGSFKDFRINVRPSGAVEFWIDGVRVLAGTTFAVLSTATLAGWTRAEKTANDTTFVVRVDRKRIAGARA